MAKTNISTAEARAEIRRLTKELNNVKQEMKAIGAGGKDGFKKLGEANRQLKDTYISLNTRISNLNKAIDQNTASKKANQAATEKSTTSNKKEKKSVDDTTKSMEKKTKSTSKAGTAMHSLSKGVFRLLQAFGLLIGVQLFINLLRDAGKLTLKFDSLRFAMQKITGTMWAMEQSQQFLLELNKKFGADLVVTTERWIRFRAAAEQSNMTLLATENIFRSVTKAAAVLGLGTDELKSVYLALEQMLSKGKVTTEELRRQLGERLPGAMGIMAASMGKTIPELDKMLKKGEVLSAEVLPGFADALEVAYGIEAVNKVETLQAALGRLTGAWQTFVANISEGESTTAMVFQRMALGAQRLMDIITYFTADDKQKFRIDILEFRDDWEEKMNRDATKALEIMEGVVDVEKNLRAEMAANRAKLEDTVGKEEQRALNDKYDELVNDLVLYGKKVNAQKRGIAEEGFLDLKKEKEDAKAEYDKSYALQLEQEKALAALFQNPWKRKARLEELEDLKAINEERYINLLNLTAEYDIKKKQLEVGGGTPDPDEDDGIKRTKRRLDDIRDLEKEIQIAILESAITTQEKVLAEEATGWEKRIFLSKQQQEYKNRIAQLKLDIEIEQIKAAEKKKLEVLNKPASDTEIPFTNAEITSQTSKINNEADQLIILAKEKLYETLIKNGTEAAADIFKISEGLNEDIIEDVKDTHNLQIIAAKENYEKSAKTAADKKILDQELKRIGVESANAQIDAQIQLLEAKILVLGADKEVEDSIRRQINQLKALKENLVPPDTEKEWKDMFEDMLGYASEFNKAVGNIVDNIYASRIENINAEIEAEKAKYDALLLLARDDIKEKEALERNRDLKMAQLEKKRLKEEQAQARAKKVFALADIAINTAVAISKVVGQTGLFGIPLVPVVAAIGAAQAAAVLAAPIPKYKDGRKGGKKEVAMINDGIFQEYIERNGTILTTDRKDAIVNLEQGDIVHKNYDALNKDSKALSGLTGGSYINETDFNRLFGNFTSSMVDGLKKVRINNSINVSQNNDSYRDKMSRWNG